MIPTLTILLLIRVFLLSLVRNRVCWCFMPSRLELTTEPVKAGPLFLFALATTFVTEYVIMTLLPLILPAGCDPTCVAIVDSCLLTLVVAPVLWVIAVRPIQRLAQSRMHLLRRSLVSQEDERQRITRDIHDGIGQSLTSLMLGLRAMEETTSDSRVLENARSLRAMGAVIHEDLRRIVRGLRPAILDQLGLVAAMERLIEDLSRTGKMTIELDTSRLAGLRLNNELESNAFRILQEAISNSLRHSSAKHISVTIGIQNDELDITVSDDGIGFDSSIVFQNEHGSYGLLSIRERAMICGGRAEIQTSIGSGTKVSARLPLTLRSLSND